MSEQLPIPGMKLELPAENKKECIISDEELVSTYNDIALMIKDDRNQVDEVLNRFIDMAMNEGDASSSTKEAIVNLFKIKSDAADKLAKLADLKTRVKLKDQDTFPRYLAAQQNNKITIEQKRVVSKKDILKNLADRTIEVDISEKK